MGNACGGKYSKEHSKIKLNAKLVAVNSGLICSKDADVTTPFLLNSASNDLKQVNDIQNVGLGGPEQETLNLESIIFIMTGSTLEGRSIMNQALLIFKFLSVTQSEQRDTSQRVPSQDQIKPWTDALPILESLKKDSSPKNLTLTVENCSQMTPGELEMREACALFTAIQKFVSDLHKDGIETFQVPILVEELIKANRLFQGLSRVKDLLLKIPEKAKKAKKAIQAGLTSLKEYYGFGKAEVIAQGPGISESGSWSYQAGVLFSDTGYRAKFDHSWKNQGLISSSAGDIIISAKSVSSFGGRRNQQLLKAANNIILVAQSHLLIENIKAENIVGDGKEISLKRADAFSINLIGENAGRPEGFRTTC